MAIYYYSLVMLPYMYTLTSEAGDDFIINNQLSGDITLRTNNVARLNISESGNIGIGTSDTRGYKVAVNGNVGAEEVEVRTDYWADFVFDADYNLKPLSNVRKYISENGHLPDVPSAKEAISQPVNLGDMDILLLQKVEELTLYAIDHDDRIKELEDMIQSQNKIIQKQSALINAYINSLDPKE